MPETEPSPGVTNEAIAEALRRVEQRLEALERWRSGLEAPPPAADTWPATTTPMPPALSQPPDSPPFVEEKGFDLAMIGRTLIVLAGAFLLRAITEARYVPVAMGVALGLAYALGWTLYSFRAGTSRVSASWYGFATAAISLPLILEAARRFNLFGPWLAALALAGVTAVLLLLIRRRRLEGLAWTISLMAMALAPVLMVATKSAVPFVLYLTALGVATLWLGYELEWTMLRWIVALELDLALFAVCFLVATHRSAGSSPEAVIVTACAAFAAYLSSFAVRTLIRRREAVPFEIAQTLALLLCAFGGAMWVAASQSILVIPLATAMIALSAGAYAVAFALIPRQAGSPLNFVFYSSLALMLCVAGGAFVTRGLPASLLFAVLALACSVLAVRFRKSSLVLHAGVYLFSGFVAAGLTQLSVRALLQRTDEAWTLPGPGVFALLLACLAAAGIRPIDRQGTFEIWTAGKAMILAEAGWIGATVLTSAAGILLLNEPGADPGRVTLLRTAVLAGLTILSGWVSRFPTLAPARLLCNPMMVLLGLKLLWEDLRVLRPGLLFISLAVVGAALILTPRLRRSASPPRAAPGDATPVPAG